MKIRSLVISLVCIAAILFSGMNVQAAGSVVFTSTADFDGGNKSDPGQDYFVSNGVDQPTYSFISKPAAIFSPAVDRTYIVYQGGALFLPYIVYYDHVSSSWSQPVIVNGTNPVAGDGHGAPAMWIDSSGYIYVFYGAHATAMQLKRSSSPHDISTWVQLNSPTPGSPPSNQGTYPHLFEHGGYIYFFYRQGTAAGGDWGFRRSNDRGETWSSFTTILDFGTDGAYIGDHIYVLSESRVYYGFVWDDRTVIIRKNAYTCYWDLTDNTQYGINGVNLGASVTLAEADTNCRAAFTGSSQAWYTSMKLNSLNRPHMIFTNGTAVVYDTWNVTHVSWNGAMWSSQTVITNSDGGSSYTDFRFISDTSIEAFITTTGFQQLAGFDDFAGDLERWTWNGSTWTFQETVMFEAKAGNPVNRPFIPTNFEEPVRVVFDSWIPKDPLLGEAKMWAWGSSGFVHRSEVTSGTKGTETITDNARISNGTFVLANGLSELFATNDSDAETYKWTNLPTGDGTGTFTREILSGTLRISASGTGSTGRLGSTQIGNFGITGDIDVRANYTVVQNEVDPTGLLSFTLCLFDQPDECDPVSGTPYEGTNGIYYQYYTGTDPTVNFFDAVSQNGTSVSLVGSSSTVVCVPTCFMRLTRVGTLFTFSYSTNYGQTYTLDESVTISGFTASTWYVAMSVESNGVNDGTSWRIDIDDYQVVNGTLDINGYRPSGSWTTPTQTFSGESLKSVVVNYSGASATNYITSIAIVASNGVILYSDNTDIISGSSATMTIDDNILFGFHGRDWFVRVSLVGNGTTSIVITDVTMNTVRSSLTVSISDMPWLIVFVAIMATGLIGAWFIRKKRGGEPFT